MSLLTADQFSALNGATTRQFRTEQPMTADPKTLARIATAHADHVAIQDSTPRPVAYLSANDLNVATRENLTKLRSRFVAEAITHSDKGYPPAGDLEYLRLLNEAIAGI